MCRRLPVIAAAALLMALAAQAQDLAVGRLLIATTKSHDPDFAKSVILLVHCDAQGAIGLMLNRPAKATIEDVFQDFAPAKNRTEAAYYGGPVSLGIRALLRSTTRPEGGVLVLPNVHALAKRALLEKTIAAKIPPSAFRVYVGYAGWSAAQLRNEVAQGLWRLAPSDAALIFDPAPESLWLRASRLPVTSHAK